MYNNRYARHQIVRNFAKKCERSAMTDYVEAKKSASCEGVMARIGKDWGIGSVIVPVQRLSLQRIQLSVNALAYCCFKVSGVCFSADGGCS